jgi:energy-coupling factor transport system permease protein
MDLMINGGDTRGLINIDPRTKVLIFFASGIISLSNYTHTASTLFTVILCTLIALCGKPKTAIKAFLLFALALYLRLILNLSQGAPSIIVTIITALSTVFMFSFPTILSILLLVKTTRISDFISAFQAMHLPIKVIVPFAVFFRFLPTVTDEWNGIRKAMAFRGISLSPVQIICHPWRTIEYILIPMLFSSISVMEELAAASMARGLDIDIKRSSYEVVKLRFIDYMLIVIIIMLTGLSVFLGCLARRGVAI